MFGDQHRHGIIITINRLVRPFATVACTADQSWAVAFKLLVSSTCPDRSLFKAIHCLVRPHNITDLHGLPKPDANGFVDQIYGKRYLKQELRSFALKSVNFPRHDYTSKYSLDPSMPYPRAFRFGVQRI